MKTLIEHTNDFYSYCDGVGIVLTDDAIAIREYLHYWQNDENIDKEIVDNVFNYLNKNSVFNLNLDCLYDWYHKFERPIPVETEFKKFWNLNKREYNRVMKFFAEKDLEHKQYEMNERIEKMNMDF